MNPQEIAETVAENEGSGEIVELNFYDSFSGFFDSIPGVDGSSVFEALTSVWNVYVVLAYIASAIFVYGFVYATMRKAELKKVLVEGYEIQEKLYQKTVGGSAKNQRWEEVLTHLDSDNPNDWKLAIIEADVLLDDAIKEKGYAGETLGERLKSISSAHMKTLDDAWEAHKVRNRVAHEGADFILTHSLARNTITQYQRVFEELEVV